jgi:hypothetical protein
LQHHTKAHPMKTGMVPFSYETPVPAAL